MTPHLAKIIVSIFLASIPAFFWGHIFYKRHPEPRRFIALTFLGGIISVFPILLYKYSWQFFPRLNVFNYFNLFLKHDLLGFSSLIYLPLSIVLAFMFVGVIEEYMKHLVVKITDHGRFRSIDDCIEYSIIAALGFSFVENIMYFFYIWHYQGIDNLFVSFIFRSLFSTFAHILFSGVFGYYYGIAYFSKPIWQEEIRKNRHPLIKFFHRIFHFKSATLFSEEKVSEGLMIAVLLHAVFNIFLEMNWTFLIVPYLTAGYLVLSYLFRKKENHKNYGRLFFKAK